MNTRLQQFLSMESLSPARFSEIMGIQRSGLSHLLSGRNNPSFEFIQKMLVSFPNLNAEWLILGKGKPYKESVQQQSENTVNQDLLFDTEELETAKPTPELPKNPLFETEHPTTSRKIDRIVIFYNNGTYEER